MLQHVQFRDFVQIRKTNVTDTICTMKTVHRVIHLWHSSVMRNYLIVTILRVTREKCRIGEKGKKAEGLGRVSSLPFSLSRFPPSSLLLIRSLWILRSSAYSIAVLCSPLWLMFLHSPGIAYVAGIWKGRGKGSFRRERNARPGLSSRFSRA